MSEISHSTNPPATTAPTTTPTTPWETFVSLLLFCVHAIIDFVQSFTAVDPDAYLPRLYYPHEPAYFLARKRDPKDIITASPQAPIKRDEPPEQALLGLYASGPGPIKQKPGREFETVSIRSFIQSRCPSLFQDYVPTWWLRSGHLNTIYCVMGDFTKKDLVDYERTLVRLPDGGTIGLDFTPPPTVRELDPKTPIVVVLHGLSGGSFESYVRDVLCTACAPKEAGGLGYRAVVMNFRGCAGVPLTTAQLYSGAHTDDLRSTLLYLRYKYPEAPLLGIGFSLGANVLTRYCEEEGENCRLRSACVLGCPWDLTLNSDRLENRWISRNLYSKAMGGNLLFLLRSHLKTLAKLAPTDATPHIERVLKMRAPTLKDFDHHVTRWMGGSPPIFPLASADEYYARSSGHKYVHEIQVPFLALNAGDDPIVAETPIDEIGRSKWVAQVVTPFGGHLGWFTGSAGGWNPLSKPPMRWVRKPVLEWLQATGEDLSEDRDFIGLGWREGKKGFVLEEGKRDVGFKVLGRAGKVEPPTGLAGQLAAAGS